MWNSFLTPDSSEGLLLNKRSAEARETISLFTRYSLSKVPQARDNQTSFFFFSVMGHVLPRGKPPGTWTINIITQVIQHECQAVVLHTIMVYTHHNGNRRLTWHQITTSKDYAAAILILQSHSIGHCINITN